MSQMQTSGKLRQSYSNGSMGRRPDLGNRHFRSSWEANYARYLNSLLLAGEIKRWEFEPDTFWFEQIRRGVRSYLPDFKVWPLVGDPYYVEIKGFLDDKSKTKLKRMAKYHPDVKIQVLGELGYKTLASQCNGVLPYWENGRVDFTKAAVGPDMHGVELPQLERPAWLNGVVGLAEPANG